MNLREEDKLDILIYNICNGNFSEKMKNQKLNIISNKFKIPIDKLKERYNWLMNLNINPNQCHLKENHYIISKIFDEYNKMLNENNIEYYYTSGVLAYFLANKNLERYHHDLDVFINMKDLEKLEKICSEYNFSFERKIGIREDGTKRVMLKMYYANITDIPITVFMYVRQKDNSIIQKDYFIDNYNQLYVEYIYNSPLISKLSFSDNPNFHNNIKYYAITPEALFLCKRSNRSKDIYDCTIFEHIVNPDKLKELEIGFNNNLPNTILHADQDKYSQYIFRNNVKTLTK